jgi:C-terminal processing protease CtpA/Prc
MSANVGNNRKQMTKLLLSVAVSFVFACGLTVLGEPPKVIKAIPDNGAIGVSANLKEMRITFDQPMSKDGMSIVGGGDTFPEIVGKSIWTNNRTIVIRFKLRPNHDYWLSINSDKFQNFKSLNGEPATPYPIKFRTAGAQGKVGEVNANEATSKVLDAKTNRRALELLRGAIHDHYSYYDRLSIDWNNVINTSSESLIAAKTPKEFAQIAATLLAQAKDKHIWLQVGEDTIPTYVKPATPNANYSLLPKLVPGVKKHGRQVVSGRWPDGIGYLAIATWDRKRLDGGAVLYEALRELADTSSLVIDVRPNSGGDEKLAQEFAGCFVSEPRIYAKNVYRDPAGAGGFSKPMERWLQPNGSHPKYKGRVVLLSGNVVMSSCESFLLMMKQVPGALIVGAASQGSSGNPKPYDLENGVTVFLPSWKDLTPDGKELEGVGVAPDIEVKTTINDFRDGDPILKTALEKLRSHK